MTSFTVQPVAGPLSGYAEVPGDKSIAHRALLLGGLVHGEVRVTGIGSGGDNQKSARAMAAMGVSIESVAGRDDTATQQISSRHSGTAGHRPVGELLIRGTGVDGLQAPGGDIDCGNSGTTMRLLCGLLAGQTFATTLFGDASLSGRPMRRVIDPLADMGASISGSSGERSDEVYPPLSVAARRSRLRAIDYAMPMASAQVKSAVLLAGLYADGTTRVREPGPSRDHTERMLAHMGAPVTVHPGGIIELDTVGWERRLACDRIVVPADPSQAAFVLCAALIAGVERVTVGNVCINPTRTGFLDILAGMGGLIEREAMSLDGGEPTANLSLSRGAGDALSGVVVAGDTIVRAIDELPILAVVAARGEGVTEIRDAAELRVKESDRIATTCAMLRALGVEVEEREDGFSVYGLAGKPFSSARIHASGDHRLGMSAAVAGLAAEGPVRVDGAECVATSFPGFAATLRGLGADIAVEEE
ncbi:MAG: 3-phosphoshikimate 1-carboxyvinyltransferase [Proteobacteria bacterium]|nr:3-phosphoshikimate 1-carboxyvinyltransferase [Pseudomonadota bacterium]